MLKNISISHIVAGFIAVMVGVASTAAIVFQAATAAGATDAQISSWLLASSLGMGLTSIGLSWYYKMPILTAWSTPGAAVLITCLAGVSMPQAMGAFVFSAVLITIAGASGWFERIIARIPKELAAAMLSGVLLQFGLNVFTALHAQLALVGAMFVTYLLGKRYTSRYTIILTLLVGVGVTWHLGLFNSNSFEFSFAAPVLVIPEFKWSVLLSVGLPLFVVTMTSQNVPGIVVMRAAGYSPPVSSIVTWTGIATMLLAPFGGFALNLAVITLAFCAGKEADADPMQRYKSSMWAGTFYCVVGITGSTVVMLFSALPKEFIMAIAGLALFSTLSNSLQGALANEKQREPALITFLVSASGVSLLGVGAAFWGLVLGIIATIILARWPLSAAIVQAGNRVVA